MSQTKFEISLESGIHHQLALLVGNWKGITKTWFEPGVIADQSPMTGTFRAVLGGRFVIHEYEGSLNGKPFEGFMIYGYDLSSKTFQCSWIDSFHMSTGMMLSTGNPTEYGSTVLGHYGGPEVPVPWGWRTVTELENRDRLVIRAYNISPEGQEDIATETIYNRVG